MIRKFMSLLACAGLCLSLAACGNSGADGGTAANDAGTAVSANNGKKVLNIASIGETDCLYPLQMVPAAYTLSRVCYDTLVTYENGEIIPRLAESWNVSDDGCTLTLNLRKGIKFHDGESFNSEAVKANFIDMQNSPASYSLPTIGTVKNIDCPDESTVVLSYDAPYYGLITDLCWTDVMVMVSPKQIEAKNEGKEVKPVGTGPYIYDEYVKGEYTRFVRNEDYWDGKPYYDEVVSKYIPDQTSRSQALKNGEIDLLYGASELSYDQYTQFLSLEGMGCKMSPIQSTSRNLTLNFNGILGDKTIREAIALSINKDTISEGMSYGYEPVADTVLTPGSLYEDECPKISYSYDADKAAKLLDDAGWKDTDNDGIRDKDGKPLSFVCTIPSGSVENNTIALLIKDMVGEVGMNMEIKEMETNDWFQSFYDPSAFDLTLQETYYDYASPTQWFGAIEYMAQGVSLPLLEDSEKFMDMVHEFKTINDETRLIEIFKYLVAQDQEQFLDIPLTGMMQPIVYNSAKIADYKYEGCYEFFNPLWITPVQ